jgi:DNA-binding MarR family transcriptional regulator
VARTLDNRCLGSNIAAVTAKTSPPRSRRRALSARPGDPEFYRGDAYAIAESVGFLLRQLRNVMDRAQDAEMTEYDLTGAQWGPLLAIGMGLGDTAAALSRFAHVDTGAMTRMLARLEAKGLLRRRRCERDARVFRLELTTEGKRLCAEIPYALSRVLNHLLRGFTEAELGTLKALIRRMLANAESD